MCTLTSGGQLHQWVGPEVVASCVTFTGKSLSEGTIFHGQTQETRTEFWSLGIFLVRGVKKCNHILSKPRLLWIPKLFAQMTVYTSSGLRHLHSINSRIQARFLHNFMAVWIPIGLCMNKFWLSLPHSWSRAINALRKIYFHTCTEVGKENVWKCQGDVTCHGDGNSYVGQLSLPQHSKHTHSEMEPCLQKCRYQHIKLRIMSCLLFRAIKYRTIKTYAVQFEPKCESC